MFRIKVHKLIYQIFSFIYLVRIWSREDEVSVVAYHLIIKLFYSALYALFPVALLFGAVLESDNSVEMIFLFELSLINTVLVVKFLFLIWKKNEILVLIKGICVYFIESQDSFTYVRNKLEILMKFDAFFIAQTYLPAISSALLLPFISEERSLFMKIAFPLDYKNDEFGFWMAYIFLVIEVSFATIGVLFSVLIWYLLFHCGLRYKVIGDKMETMGAKRLVEDTLRGRKVEDEEMFRQKLLETVKDYRRLTKSTKYLGAFLSKVFVAQLITSGVCLCCSVYCLAFNRGDSFLEAFLHIVAAIYVVFDIFMVMYFGNEIKLGSDRLSYCLFMSNWTDRSQKVRNEVFIFGEHLIQPQELVILKLFPLTLDTFTMILRSAYSMFNILQNFK